MSSRGDHKEERVGAENASLPPLVLPQRYNYAAAFLTMGCTYRCSFCINRFGGAEARYPTMPGADWVRGLNRIVSRPDLPVTLQGGEPALHPDFYAIVRGLRPDLRIDMLTVLPLDADEFMANVPPDRMKRDAPYASIRVSYHPEVMRLRDIKRKVLALLDAGYSVGIWAVRHPDWIDEIERAQQECAADGIDFRFKEFLGVHDGRLYGTYKYPEAVSGRRGSAVQCRTTELLIGTDGSVYRCHSDLYARRPPVGHICDPEFRIEDVYRSCGNFGLCNPCDIKVKTNRYQEFGHTSVEIRRDSDR